MTRLSHPEYHLEPDNYPSVAEESLSPFERQVRAHWERFRPQMSRQLKANDQLDTAVRAAVWRHEYQVMLTLSRSPGLHRLPAEDLFNQYLWLPPESPTTPDSQPATTSSPPSASPPSSAEGPSPGPTATSPRSA